VAASRTCHYLEAAAYNLYVRIYRRCVYTSLLRIRWSQNRDMRPTLPGMFQNAAVTLHAELPLIISLPAFNILAEQLLRSIVKHPDPTRARTAGKDLLTHNCCNEEANDTTSHCYSKLIGGLRSGSRGSCT
jgi:hypothetical protein